MKFAIWTPLPETAPHAGVRALWILGRELVARGHDVAMWIPGEPTPDCDVLILPERTAPATTNPRTVRWVLLHGGARRKGERIYTWSLAYADAPELRVPYFNLDEFTPTTEPRHGTAVWVGKGHSDQPLPDDTRPITYDLPRAEVLEILRTSERLLSFDAYSAVNTEATLFGTPVHLPMKRPDDMPIDADLGFRWADVDNSQFADEARDTVFWVNSFARLSIEHFLEDMLAWM